MLLAFLTKAFDSSIRVGQTLTLPIGTPHGIASLEQIDLNGYPQWLLIRQSELIEIARELL